MELFSAGAQFDDWKGEVKADNADLGGLSKYLKDKGLLTATEMALGIEVYFGERGRFAASCLVMDRNGHHTFSDVIRATAGPVKLRKIRIEMEPSEFFALFKRFSIALELKAVDLIGREIDIQD